MVFYVEATTREMLARLDLWPMERLLDVGCGTGALLRRLAAAHPGTLLCGVDPVPEMLAVAPEGAGGGRTPGGVGGAAPLRG